MTLVAPQQVTLYQVGDLVEGVRLIMLYKGH